MTQQINFPQSQIVDNQGNLSLEWREWLLNPQTLTAKFSIALGVSSGGTGSSSIPTNGQILIGNGTSYAVSSLGAGTGLTVTAGAGTLSVGITNTAVTAGTYGSASKSVTYTVNAQGQFTASSEQLIAIANTQVSGLGTMSTQNASAVAITGGTITGTTVSGMTLSATAGTTMTFPTTNATIARTDAAQTFTGTQTFASTISGSINGNAATVTTNANLTGPITSVGNATSVASQTGTGSKFVMDTSPALITPSLGVASATSITFGGSALANYDEGTFVPTLVSSGGGTPTYGVQVGTYTRIGNRLLYQLRLTLTGTGTLAAGNLTIANLPVSSNSTANNFAAQSITANNLAATVATQVEAQIQNSATSIVLLKYATGAGVPITVADLTATSIFNIAGQYQL